MAKAAKGFKAPPIKGYQNVSSEKQDLVNQNKEAEERILRQLDHLATLGFIDQRWLAMGRASIENGFMQINRSIFVPSRVKLPEDGE